MPTPLLLIYKDSLHLSPQTLTALFGCYAAGLVPSLLVAGPLSDGLDRRRVVLPFVVLSAVASLPFATAELVVAGGQASPLPELFVGRFDDVAVLVALAVLGPRVGIAFGGRGAL